MRGEHWRRATCAVLRAGSSPLARGALANLSQLSKRVGIIPACAGSTSEAPRSCTSSRDHPRLRGEHELKEGVVVSVKGSSPLARGALFSRVAQRLLRGIIPACAGSTSCLKVCCLQTWDHPRLRGEHASPFSPLGMVKGSSPLARGARLLLLQQRSAGGIIPACAGSTAFRFSFVAYSGDHPRLRGEHWGASGRIDQYWGSSPLARGAPLLRRHALKVSGIIPACAGSTPQAHRHQRHGGDHPRLRGEHPPSTSW